MNRSIAAGVGRAADSEAPRAQRARSVADIVRVAGGYRGVTIYDVNDDEVVVIGSSGSPRASERTIADATVVEDNTLVVPILGPESGIVMGGIEVENDGAAAFSAQDVALIEECAAMLRPLYD